MKVIEINGSTCKNVFIYANRETRIKFLKHRTIYRFMEDFSSWDYLKNITSLFTTISFF